MGFKKEVKEMVAIRAAAGGNCIPCLEWHYKKSIELKIPKEDIKEVVDIAEKVKEVPIKKIYAVSDKLLSENRKGEING